MATRKPAPRTPVRRTARRRGFGAWLGRKVRTWGRKKINNARARWREIFEPKVVLNWRRDGWQRAFPSPGNPRPMIMQPTHPTALEDYRAFYGEVEVDFTLVPYSQIPLPDEALAAAIVQHGKTAASWTLDRIEPLNEPARYALSRYSDSIYRP